MLEQQIVLNISIEPWMVWWGMVMAVLLLLSMVMQVALTRLEVRYTKLRREWMGLTGKDDGDA